ncbi:helix turn helix mercury resistance [Trichococcus palustris]|jgi:DNA-binding transcriptional MerR regulator|uniref:Helix turn helix mercury resistance n=1 Tax=Trichococcus palustris TaxID=140314 RepID=A0A143YMF6_9LACT|nr:MerR family transcriptional regulator [Trichococcus palustris]CZQ92500.1 helix turn helix mercury resistance [Trichococcus palustris]SFL05360.1 DNA-binding transcriptional regulator, MerR family [Trichococcus palustris]
MYTVKEVSKMLGMTEHTIRFYTDKGLVPSLQRNQNNNRLFDEKSIHWLKGAQILRGCGMSIEVIKAYVDLCLQGDSTIRERYEIILKQKEIVDAKLIEITQKAESITNKANNYEYVMNHLIPDNSNPDKW